MSQFFPNKATEILKRLKRNILSTYPCDLELCAVLWNAYRLKWENPVPGGFVETGADPELGARWLLEINTGGRSGWVKHWQRENWDAGLTKPGPRQQKALERSFRLDLHWARMPQLTSSPDRAELQVWPPWARLLSGLKEQRAEG